MAKRSNELTLDAGETEGRGNDVETDGESFSVETSDLTTDLGVDGTKSGTAAATTESKSSLSGRIGSRVTSLFSPSSFALQFIGSLFGVFVVGNVIPLVPFTGFVGLFVMAGLAGTLSAGPRYLEAALAGCISGGVALFLGMMVLSFVTGGLVPLIGAIVGALVSIGGFYAGRDLRAGLTKDL